MNIGCYRYSFMKRLLLLTCMLCKSIVFSACDDFIDVDTIYERGHITLKAGNDSGLKTSVKNKIHESTTDNTVNDVMDIKRQYGIPEDSDIDYVALKQYKACREISRAQILVEHTWNINDVKEAYKILKYYASVFDKQINMLRSSNFLYVSMRILKDEVIEHVNCNILQALCNADVGVDINASREDNWKNIYKWLVENAEETLGEYYV